MKNFAILFLLAVLCSLHLFAQCETEPTLNGTDKIVAETTIESKTTDTLILEFTASAVNTGWSQKGAEAAVLTVFVNGKYNQDVMLYGGAEPTVYKIVLGTHGTGKHKISLAFNSARSATKNAKITVSQSSVKNIAELVKKGEVLPISSTALPNTPFIYARPNAIDKFTDIPLVTYYEIVRDGEKSPKIRFTTIFSHEDGGTNATGLMARWGRVTDIEWVYEFDSTNSKQAIYQGANHETKNFNGKRIFGQHPLIFTVTDNNNFADTGCSPLRFAPLPIYADLSKDSRETLMEKFPWTYRLMAEEVIREGRVNSDKPEANIIADPREYLYVEVQTELQNAAISVEANGNSSDSGNKFLRVNRNGFVRIALRLPEELKQNYPDKLAVRCHAVDTSKGESVCKTLNVIKIVRLDKDFKPLEKQLKRTAKGNIKAGEAAEFIVG